MERILVLSDDSAWRETTAAELADAGHKARAAGLSDPEEPEDRLSPYTAILVDLRGQTGAGARLAGVRRSTRDFKLFLIAALNPAQLDQMDFTAGFDDFLLEPFAPGEVAARVRQLRWRANRTESADLLKAGDLLINLASCEVSLQGMPLSLTYQEYELLRYLVQHRGRVFTREQLLSELWGYNYYGGTRTVDVHVRRLRAKLGPEHEDLIQTVRNVGYRFSRDA